MAFGLTFNEDQFKRFKARISGLKSEYTSFEAHHRELAEYILPRLGRWITSDTNKGGKRNGKIVDNTGKMALRILASGMMSGLTSPARPWFNLVSPNPEFQERQDVKIWLETVKKRINTVLARSNVYDSLQRIYAELSLFGQGPMGMFEHFSNVMWTQTYTAGEYWIANDEYGMVNTIARSYRQTVGQVVGKYGLDACSSSIKSQYDKGNYDSWVDLHHIVEPNRGRDIAKADNINMPFRSVYWEQSSSSKALSFTGYEEFPVFCPRWDLNDGDVYANSCPGMDALGDIKQLQLHEKRSAEAVEKFVRPSMVADPSLKNKKKSQLAGGVTYSAFVNGEPGFREAYKVNARINELEAKSEQIRNRIRAAFYADLFLMLSTTDRREITAREVEERHEEKLLMLGPVLERLNKELLDPLITRTFNIMFRAGLIPPPPREIAGQRLKIEYVSVLHQAQRSVGVSSVDRFFLFTGNALAIDPEARFKVNVPEAIDQYGEMLGINPAIINSDEQFAALKEGSARAQQLALAMEAGEKGAGIVKDLATTQSAEDSALSRLAGAAA